MWRPPWKEASKVVEGRRCTVVNPPTARIRSKKYISLVLAAAGVLLTSDIYIYIYICVYIYVNIYIRYVSKPAEAHLPISIFPAILLLSYLYIGRQSL
jgi:hypothetical protein